MLGLRYFITAVAAFGSLTEQIATPVAGGLDYILALNNLGLRLEDVTVCPSLING